MTQRSLSVLIVLNVVLLAAIALTFGPTNKAQAQLGGGGGEYLMLAGNSGGLPQQVIYILDKRSGNLAAITINSANGKVDLVGKRELAKDLKTGGQGR